MSPAETRVGILTQGGPQWMGGINYVNNIFKAFESLPRAKRPKVCLVVRPGHSEHLEWYRPAVRHADRIYIIEPALAGRGNLGPRIEALTEMSALKDRVDFLYPVTSWVLPELPAVSWIPDFQHRYLPHLFTAQELAERDRNFGFVATHARMVVFSSDSAARDFRCFHPDSAAETRVLRFPSIMDDAVFGGDPDAVRRKHGLPEVFLMCCNQFWAHKDHGTLFRALAVLKRRGLVVHLACTGNTEDHRNRAYFPRLMAEMRELGIAEQVSVLGMLDRHEQLQLLRAARAVVQPSLFEGWSTVVEDSRSLGKFLFLSDFSVHVEQAPPHGVYFPCGDAEALASAIAEHLPQLAPEVARQWEAEAAQAMQEQTIAFAVRLQSIARDMQAMSAKA